MAYFRRAATNASIDLLRRKAARPEREAPELSIEGRADDVAHQSSPLLKERLRRALAKISPADAELFILCYLEGYSYDELAALMELARGTVASRLHRTREVLRKDFSK